MRTMAKWQLTVLLAVSTVASAMAQNLSQVSVFPTSVEGGRKAILTVLLDAEAPRGGATVNLSSSDASVAKLPASVTVERRHRRADVVVQTQSVTAATPVTLTATLNNVSMTATLTVSPLDLSSLEVDPDTVLGGNNAMGFLTLNGPAPSGGWVINLASDNAAATVPATVTVQSGRTGAHFQIATTTVTAEQTVTVTATDPNGVTQTATLTVVPLQLAEFRLDPNPVTGGGKVFGTVTLTGPAPNTGMVISLTSDNAAVTVPPTVTVNAGMRRARFVITTSAVSAATTANLTATDPNNVTVTATLTVNPVQLAHLDIDPSRVRGGKTTHGYIYLNGVAPSGGLVITLSSDNAAATVPATVTVPAGKWGVSFDVATTAVTAATTVTITATDPGGVVKTAKLFIR